MTTSTKLKRARKRLEKAQTASAKFDAKHKGAKLSPSQGTEQYRLSQAELAASIELTGAKKRPKRIDYTK